MLITGASSGIGNCLAQQAQLRGIRVAVTARKGDRLRLLTRSAAGSEDSVISVEADLTSEDDRQRLVRTVVDRFGGLDVLINNAGVASFGHFSDSSEDVLRKIMEVNFFAPAELTRLCIPILAQGEQPAIVNIASMCGRRGLPAWTEYSASKFALCGLSEALRGEMARFGIDVLLIVPGLTQTGLGRNLLRNTGRMEIDFGKGMTPEFVASKILSALERNRSETVLGGEARWMLRVHRFFPRLLDRLLARKVRRLYASGQETEVRGQKSEVRDQKSEVRGQKSEVRGQKSEMPSVHLFGSGPILREALRAQEILAERYGIGADVWSATSYKELRRDALEAERWNLLHPGEKPKRSYLERVLEKEEGVFIAASDYMKAVPEMIDRWVPGGLYPLGTDGFGRSEDRTRLRRFFEVDAELITLAALSQLARKGAIKPATVEKAVKELDIDPEKPNPLRA